MKKTFFIKPRYIIAITAVIAVIMVVSAYLELTQSRNELFHLMTEQAASLIETITISGSNTLISSTEIENLIAQRLLTTGRMIAQLDSLMSLKQTDLQRFAQENNIFRINIFDQSGNKVLSSHIPDPIHNKLNSKNSPIDFIKPILQNEKSEIIIGIKEARYEEGMRFAVAVRRAKNKKGAIVLNVDANYLLDFRKKIGIGKILQDIGNNEGIEYIMLQDEDGIIAASYSVKEAVPIEEDPFLQQANLTDTIRTRVHLANDKEIFEVVKSFKVSGEKIGLLRVGLSMEQIHSLRERMIRRSIIISLVLLVISAIVISIIFINQNLQLVSKEYNKIKTYTGNILQNMADAVISTDKNGNVTIFNEQSAKIFGVQSSDVFGKNLESILDGKLSTLTDSLKSGKALENKEIEIELDKGIRTLSINTTFINNQQGELEAFTAVIRDLTEIKKMENQIKQREKLSAMGELASGVAHEIKNPLNSIYMISQRLKKEFKPKENNTEFESLTGALIAEINRINKIIMQFLKFARPPKLNLSEVNSNVLINEVKILIESSAKEKGIDFQIDEKDEITMKIDKDQMKQVLINILQNSLDATHNGGYIKLQFYTHKKKAFFIIEDNGEGIAKENLPKIFNLYYSTKQTGTGLGLSIVQQIISQHNGNISVESQLGKGTKFIIELPLT